MSANHLQELFHEWREGRLSRRSFISSAMALGLSAGAASVLVSGGRRAAAQDPTPAPTSTPIQETFGEEGAAGAAGHLVVGSLSIQDGSWINFSAALFRAGLPGAMDHATITSTTAMAAGIIVVAVLLKNIV